MAVLCGVAAQSSAAPPPASAFGRVPAVVEAEISPDGQRIAILGGTSEQRVISIATIDQPGLPVLQLGAVEATRLRWAGDAFVIASVAYWEKTDGQRSYRIERHIAVTPQAKAVSRFFDNLTTSQFLANGQPIAGVTADAPSRVLITDLVESLGAQGTMNTRLKRKGLENASVRALWSIDPATGKGRVVERGDPDTQGWDVDLSGEARVRRDIDELSHRREIFGRAKGKSQWTQLWAESPTGPEYRLLGYADPDDAVYLEKDGKIVRRKLADGVEEPVSDGGFSMRLVWDTYRNSVAGIVSGADQPTAQWLDAEVGAAHGVLARAFKGKDVSLAGWSKDRTRFIARVASPSSPGAWYLYDRARKEVSPLGEEYPELQGVALGTTRWITYKARDGLEIPAYVTIPAGAAPRSKLPLIVLPHGGPAARDGFDFDYIAQFFASRGYAVLQPQFRGSAGFSREFREAGKGEWGGKMQTDLLDGVAALTATGEVDSGRVCIVGASFGGYAALAGASLHPDAYRCAASIAGVSDLGQLIAEEARLFGRSVAGFDELREELGVADRGKLEAMSPALHAAAVKVPVLLIHGDQDTVVLPAQSQRMANALKAVGKPYELVILENENHYLTKSATRTQTLEVLERFLAKNLPVN
ncbi:MAG: S9 family peptidase [Alphaproteobacteria bacterium]|nr:S9 family peptidase [Alphaproteobacteria bacterium]MBU1516173.1 S9 family peptidase [Alphaproteobacteria bacterium]MBU2096545.1 S9 family peptidase [Alphaproteobacteria bacterium]MBU2154049.1 S9 family peptidase [Alphaproteobacteria bacterium]MBU2309691.1 S9 family peptidase [Alphaproteobacteria bacterium]